MFDYNYMLLNNATSGNAFNVIWMPHTPVVFCVYAASGTPTVTLKGCDTENGTYETIGTVTGSADEKVYKRFLTPYKYIKATATAACTFSIVPTGEHTEPDKPGDVGSQAMA